MATDATKVSRTKKHRLGCEISLFFLGVGYTTQFVFDHTSWVLLIVGPLILICVMHMGYVHCDRTELIEMKKSLRVRLLLLGVLLVSTGNAMRAFGQSFSPLQIAVLLMNIAIYDAAVVLLVTRDAMEGYWGTQMFHTLLLLAVTIYDMVVNTLFDYNSLLFSAPNFRFTTAELDRIGYVQVFSLCVVNLYYLLWDGKHRFFLLVSAPRHRQKDWVSFTPNCCTLLEASLFACGVGFVGFYVSSQLTLVKFSTECQFALLLASYIFALILLRKSGNCSLTSQLLQQFSVLSVVLALCVLSTITILGIIHPEVGYSHPNHISELLAQPMYICATMVVLLFDTLRGVSALFRFCCSLFLLLLTMYNIFATAYLWDSTPILTLNGMGSVYLNPISRSAYVAIFWVLLLALWSSVRDPTYTQYVYFARPVPRSSSKHEPLLHRSIQDFPPLP